RSLFPGWEKQSDLILAGYDATNRQLTIYGEISFADLFTQQWSVLMPRMIENVKAGPANLFKDKAAVSKALYDLASLPLSYQTLFSGDMTDDKKAAHQLI